jgi:Immune inhibitor A-like, MAM domain
MRLKIAAATFVFALLAVFAASLFTGTSTAEADPPAGAEDVKSVSEEIRNAGENANFAANELPPPARGDDNRFPPRLGDHRLFVALDDTLTNPFYLKEFELRAFNDTAEIWIASGPATTGGVTTTGLNFPDGDCRNDGVRNVVTDEQAEYLLDEFTNNILATDTDWFGEPVTRTGKNAALFGVFNAGQISANAYRNNEGRFIALIDNIRDDNFNDENNDNSLPYIAGFFTSAASFFHDRNIISVDGFDWLHRTGAFDPDLHSPTTDPCTSAPYRPFLYESVFAHEFKHLITNDIDPGEFTWVDEGMADFAEILTGYSDPSLHIDEAGHDSHTQSFLGWEGVFNADFNPIPRPAGPENSLTIWEDQGDLEILADYGHAYYFMTYLNGQGYGQDFFSSWHSNPLNGIEGLDDALADAGSSDTFASLFQDIQVSALADAYLDDGATLTGESAADIQNPGANATLFFSGDAFDTLGAPPWGSDFIPLAGDLPLTSIEFDGDETFTFPGDPEWVVDGDGYWTNPDDPDTDLYPPDSDFDIARQVSVPAAPAALTFEHYYELEDLFDYGFVQVSDDGGETWTSLPCTGTTSDHDATADPNIVAQLPGYNGQTGGGTAAAPLSASCDLSAYGGQNILLSFRLMTDPLVEFDGWHVRNVLINGTAVDPTPEDLSDWNNQQFFNPAELAFDVQVVGLNGEVDQDNGRVSDGTEVMVVRLTLDANNEGSVLDDDIQALNGFDQVVVIISGIPQSEASTLYSPYSLLVNGDERADGAGVP